MRAVLDAISVCILKTGAAACQHSHLHAGVGYNPCMHILGVTERMLGSQISCRTIHKVGLGAASAASSLLRFITAFTRQLYDV